MGTIRLAFLWHMHQPYYKDLVTGQYRLPWVRLHALKDYYGMVKLLDEFPAVRQTFNLVPSLITQLEEYVNGKAHDPFLEIAAKPAPDLTPEEKRFALSYFFQANPARMIARYPRYDELFHRFRGTEANPERATTRFHTQDFADLQVLSQIAWLDEFFLEEPEIAGLARKGKGFTAEDQRQVIGWQRELMARVLPAYTEAAQRGAIEISTSAFYHPILPLVCDTDAGTKSSPGLKLPQKRFRHPEDARAQLQRGLELHERVFHIRPCGVWPSEGGISDEALRLAAESGARWMATDEGVLGRSLDFHFTRNHAGILTPESARRLYRVYEYDAGGRPMHLFFRDHGLSDLIGFVYAGMPAVQAAEDFTRRLKESAQPLLSAGVDAVISVILDGENAWEYYDRSGREFLRRLYEAIVRDPEIQAVTMREAIGDGEASGKLRVAPPPAAAGVEIPESGQQVVGTGSATALDSVAAGGGDATLATRNLPLPSQLSRLVPGSWINANFNIWVGAPEDNRAWDYLSAARDFYANFGMIAAPEQRSLAYEEILIAEGSDWNWWYGPEHHSANDADFDELYRKHLSNVYLALGAHPPDYLAHPIAAPAARPSFVPQTSYIHPRIAADYERYFDWVGAAMYTSDRRAGAMHAQQFLLESVRAGIDEESLYGRIDFAALPEDGFEIRVIIESFRPDNPEEGNPLMLVAAIEQGKIEAWDLRHADSTTVLAGSEFLSNPGIHLAFRRNFSFEMPLALTREAGACSLRLRFALWRERLPLDAMPLEDWIELPLVSEEELTEGMQLYSAFS